MQLFILGFNLIIYKITLFQEQSYLLRVISAFQYQSVFNFRLSPRIADRGKSDYAALYKLSLFYYMESVLTQLQLKINWKQSMRKSCRANKLNVDLVSNFTPLRFRNAYLKLINTYSRKKDEILERWVENQLKAYYWVLVAVSCVRELTIQHFTQSQWEILNAIFYFKNPSTLEYQAKKLVHQLKNQLWAEEEELLLFQIINSSQVTSNKWNELARRLYQLSHRKYFRTGKQCRERWLNHLDPAKKHGDWTEDEDKELSSLFLQYGKKWSLISRKLSSNRTEHMVKNRYKTIMSKQKRLFPNIKSQSILLKSFNGSLPSICHQQQKSAPSQKIRPESQQNQQKIEQNLNYYDDAECQQICMERQFVVYDGQKEGPNLTTSYQLPPLFSPWNIDRPSSPVYSPSPPYFLKFTPTFQSYDANCLIQFQCLNRINDQADYF